MIMRINRNIVECKDSRKHIPLHEPYRINRNIVECKVLSFQPDPSRSSVLIETLWNVKTNTLPAKPQVFTSINRNIVECKEEDRLLQLLLRTSVLIETLWNVKINTRANILRSPGINRNIVECKVRCEYHISNLDLCINRNIVECKVRSAIIRYSSAIVLIETLWNVK